MSTRLEAMEELKRAIATLEAIPPAPAEHPYIVVVQGVPTQFGRDHTSVKACGLAQATLLTREAAQRLAMSVRNGNNVRANAALRDEEVANDIAQLKAALAEASK